MAHRRAGKTVAFVNDLIKRAILSPRDDYRGAYLAPYFRQAKDATWQYLKRYSEPLWAGPPNESELWVPLLNGSRVRIYGADNPDALRGGYLDDALLDEYADMRPGVWGEIIRPMLADRQGAASFIGTPKGKNAFWDIYQRSLSDPDNWFGFMLRASETGLIPASELALARQDMTAEQYEQEFECSFEAAIMGAYFGREMAEAERSGRIPESLPRLDAEVHTAWDFGNGANMAVWCFQQGPVGPHVIDFIQISGMYFNDYLREVRERGYTGFAYVPHDARVPDFATGRTRIETMLAEKFRPVVVSNYTVEDGISAAKLTLPRTRFDGGKCASGLEALRQYKQDWDEKARVFKNAPRHDWASHSADAFRYLALAWKEHIQPTIDKAQKPVIKGLNEITFDELMANENVTGERAERV